jgi:aldose 1-epimerase
VRTRIENLSSEPMPVAIGYHPYLQLTDSRQDEWTISIGARVRFLASSGNISTVETQPIEKSFANPQSIPLISVKGKNQKIDVLIGPNYRAAIVWAAGAGQQGRGAEKGAGGPPTGAGAGAAGAGAGGERGGARGTPGGAATPGQESICFEPMAGITNALNLAQKGLYKELQSIPAGGVWQESFWVRPSGY